MAGRVSRRQQIFNRNNNVAEEKEAVKIIFRAGLYRRLSLLDGGYGKESESLENQEMLIRDYLSKHSEIELADIYTDNGETGTDFERSGFNRLMDDIRGRKINCVIVKDLSRFGRNYLETEEYIEKIFPFLGIRFIAVLDNVDTFSPDCRPNEVMRSMKNLMNEAYSRDLSSKIGAAFDAKRANGEMLYRIVPYGYKKSGDPKHPYIIDEPAAQNIRMFFEMYADGYSLGKIAEHCNNICLPTPSEYKAAKGLGGSRIPEYSIWNGTMIGKMLRNPVYLGHMQQEISYRRFCDNQPQIYYPKSQWKLYKNVNEPIISQELWDKVQSMLLSHSYSKSSDCPERHKESLVDGLVFCKCCGKPVSRRWRNKGKCYYYLCRTHNIYGNVVCMNLRTIMERDMENAVAAQIRTQLEILGKHIREIPKYEKSHTEKQTAELDARIKAAETELNRKKLSLITLFEQLCTGQIDERQYACLKVKSEAEITKKSQELSGLVRDKERLSEMKPANEFLEKVSQYNPENEISKGLIAALVERIEFDDNKNITVKMKYRDIFQDLISSAENSEV